MKIIMKKMNNNNNIFQTQYWTIYDIENQYKENEKSETTKKYEKILKDININNLIQEKDKKMISI